MKSISKLVTETRKKILDMVVSFQDNAGHRVKIDDEDDFDDLENIVDILLETFVKEIKNEA